MILNIIYLLLILLSIGAIFASVYYFLSDNFKKTPQIDVLYTDALNSMVKGDTINAVNILKTIVKQDSDHVRAYLQLGNILQKEKPDQALKIHQSLTVRPNLEADLQVDIHTGHWQMIIVSWEITKVQLLRLKKILQIEKRNLWALRFLIRISEEDQNWERAAFWTKQLRKVSSRKSTSNEAKFDVYMGLDCLKNGNIEDAKKLFKRAIKVSSESGYAYRYLGDTYEKTRDLVKAVENWKKFAEKEIKNGQTVYEKIESALFDLGRYSEVENFYRKILELDNTNFEAIIRLANVLEEKGESGAALTLLESAINKENHDVRVNIMKLKLSLITSTPTELSHQIDNILKKLSYLNENKIVMIILASIINAQNIDMYLSLIHEGQSDGVEEIIPELISKYPNDPGVIYLKALLTENALKSLELYSSILKRFPESKYSGEAAVKIGEYFYAKGLYSQAGAQLSPLPRKYPRLSNMQQVLDMMISSFIAIGQNDSVNYYLSIYQNMFPNLDTDKYGLSIIKTNQFRFTKKIISKRQSHIWCKSVLLVVYKMQID